MLQVSQAGRNERRCLTLRVARLPTVPTTALGLDTLADGGLDRIARHSHVLQDVIVQLGQFPYCLPDRLTLSAALMRVKNGLDETTDPAAG